MKHPGARVTHRARRQKWVVWSLDGNEDQTFQDILYADNAKDAAKRVLASRPYATLDSMVEPCLLTEFIKELQRELIDSSDGFDLIEPEDA